jgi:hypothetical protein
MRLVWGPDHAFGASALTANSRVSCAADGLHGDDADLVDGSEFLEERGEWDDYADDCAVGITDEETLFEIVVLTLR